MSKRFWFILAAALLVAFFIKRGGRNLSTDTSDMIEYQGQSIKLSKSYSDYEDYKDDPNNIAASELPKVQQLVKSTPVPKHFASRDALIHSTIFDLQFPGYGLTAFGETPQTDGTTLSMWSIEIPHADSDRYLLYRGRAGAFDLIDDFVAPDPLAIGTVTLTGDRLVYKTSQGAKLAEHAIRTP